jgi:hypothetical protein
LANREKSSTIIFFLIATLIAIMGGYFVYRSTHWSPWAFSDSAAYLSAARNFGDGRGLVILNSNGTATRMTEFAPLYPILLSIFTGRSGDFIETARWLNIIAFTLSIFFSGIFTFKITRNRIAAWGVSLFIALSPFMLDAFTGMMSEPIFILLLIIQFLFLWSYISQPKWELLIPLVLVSLLLPLTRYAGIVFPMSAGILLILLGKKGFKRNLIRGLTFAVITLLPIGLWFLDLYLKLDKVGGKRFSFDISIFSSFFRSVFSEYMVLRTWYPYYGIYPGRTINLLIEVLFTLLIFSSFSLGAYRVIKSWSSLEKYQLSFLIGLSHVSLYLVFIALLHSITIPQIDIINRMLAPILPLSMLLLAAVFSMEIKRKKNIPWQLPLAVLLLVAARYNYLITTHKISEYYANGFGFNSREIQQSGFINALHDLDKEKPMISNSAAFVLFHTNRFPLDISQFHNRQYGSSDGYGEKTFRERHAPLIIHLPDFRNTYGADADNLLETLTTGLVQTYADRIGAIYYYPN